MKTNPDVGGGKNGGVRQLQDIRGVIDVSVRILWVSRHALTPENMDILREAFGDDIMIKQIDRTLTPEDIRALIKKYGTDTKYVVVLPPHLIQELLNAGAEVYRFRVEREYDPETDQYVIRPVGLEQILEIKYVTRKVV